MAKHTTYRGVGIDMDGLRRENEKTLATGNMSVNARGDLIKGGKITKTADEMARERGRVQSVLVQTGLKGPMPKAENINIDAPKPVKPSALSGKKTKETELPSGDIIIEEDKNAN